MTESGDLLAELGELAQAVSAQAWCPHSGFRVGAALRDDQGRVHVGCNVESDSYGLTQCAERNAVAAAVAAGLRPGAFDALVIYVPGQQAWPPCGACRQIISEHLPPEATVVSFCDGAAVSQWRVRDLLPQAFSFSVHAPPGDARE